MNDNYDRLTNESKLLLLEMYQSYQVKRTNGSDRETALWFGNSANVLKTVSPDSTQSDVESFLIELRDEEFCVLEEDMSGMSSVRLSYVAIARMQNRFKDGVKTAMNLLIKLV